IDPDRLVNLLVELLAPLDIFGCEPHPQSLVSHLRVQALCEILILRAVADETRIELDRLHRTHESPLLHDESIGHAAPAKETLRDVPFGEEERVDANRARRLSMI